MVSHRPADRAQQNGVSGAGTLQRLVGQRHTVLVDGRAAQLVIAQLEAQIELVTGQLQHLTASAMISGPMPSPGRTRICLDISYSL